MLTTEALHPPIWDPLSADGTQGWSIPLIRCDSLQSPRNPDIRCVEVEAATKSVVGDKVIARQSPVEPEPVCSIEEPMRMDGGRGDWWWSRAQTCGRVVGQLQFPEMCQARSGRRARQMRVAERAIEDCQAVPGHALATRPFHARHPQLMHICPRCRRGSSRRDAGGNDTMQAVGTHACHIRLPAQCLACSCRVLCFRTRPPSAGSLRMLECLAGAATFTYDVNNESCSPVRP